MKTDNIKIMKLLALIGVIPFIYGCGSGAGAGSLVGFLFGGGGFTGGEIALLGSGAGSAIAGSVATTGTQLATLHHPEPASFMLLGSGLMAMGYFKSKINKHK